MRRRGFTLVELLIAMGILAGILTLVAVYFGDQRDLTQRTQSRSEVQDRVRMVMQMVTQDLQMVGSRGFLDSSGNLITTVSSGCSGVNCLTSTNAGVQDGFAAQYVTSLRTNSAQACRAVNMPLAAIRSSVRMCPAVVRTRWWIWLSTFWHWTSSTSAATTPRLTP
jgi:prepilin-type N-terminal cleavage/methylation domain-containing protein